MEASIKKLPKSKIELTIEIAASEFNEFFEEAISNLGKDLEVEGFRKGKVPKKIIEREIGQGKILEEAVQLAVKKNYIKAILENKIEVISQPEIEVLKAAPDNPLIFRARCKIIPEINLPDYKKIAKDIKRNKILVEEEEVEAAVKWLQRSRAKFSLKNGACQIRDFVEIEYSLLQIEDERKREDKFILGEGHLIPGFEKNLEGLRANQEKEFSLVFPKDYFQRDLAAKQINFKVKMKSVKSVEFPEINDQFAQGLGAFENLNKLKESIRGRLNLEKEMAEGQRVRSEILEKITKELDFEIPEILIESEKNRLFEDFQQRTSQILGITFNEYLKKINKKESEILEPLCLEAKKRVKSLLVLREIAKREEIEISEEEVKEGVSQFSKNYSDIETAKKFDIEKLKEYTKEAILNEKTLQFLENFTIATD